MLRDGSVDGDGARIGYRSVGVRGTGGGLALARRKYGKLTLAQVMAPAMRLAEQGFPVSEKLARELAAHRSLLERFPMSKRIFLKDGALYQPGEILRQPELAATLKRIARHGSAEFYRGETARKLASEMERMNGPITLEDLANYKVKVREPLRASYKAGDARWEVISSPPPSSGGVAMIEALNMLNGVPRKSGDDAQSVHMVAETLRRRC